MAFSIRTRLTFWYTALLFVSLLAFGAVFSYSLLKTFVYRMDNQIISIADMMVHSVIRPSGQIFIPKDFDIMLERHFGVRTAGSYIQVLEPHGNVIAKSSNLDFSLNVPPPTYRAAIDGATTYEVVKTVGKYPMRVVTKPIVLDGKLIAIVQVGSSFEGMDEIFHSLAFILIPGILASVVVAGAVGWFLARKALKPVTEITATARKITAENLDERIRSDVPQDELGRLAATMNEMIERLEKSFKQIRQFTGDASHELKTPLTILKGEIEMALRSKDDVRYMKEVLASSLEEIDRMSYIVKSLLDLAKMDVEKGALAKEPVRLDKVVSDRYEHLRKRAFDSAVQLDILENKPVTVLGDQVRLSQLVYNLIDNAIKYTHKGGRVELSLAQEGQTALFKVKDTGVGISAEDLPFIFDRFYRVDKARTREVGGAGLGLSICKEIAEAHGGTLSVVSQTGTGTTFTASFPSA
ncbi:two-component system, OmpR family, heavy metal sensor histidine kinase CusS [uncultured bacterium]|nr:two-component system, OmpR family, heavy metal sensor histidine kinase CusS [uncultured bacterium]